MKEDDNKGKDTAIQKGPHVSGLFRYRLDIACVGSSRRNHTDSEVEGERGRITKLKAVQSLAIPASLCALQHIGASAHTAPPASSLSGRGSLILLFCQSGNSVYLSEKHRNS